MSHYGQYKNACLKRNPHGYCFYCRSKFAKNDLTIDHYIPKSKGGTVKDNLVLACVTCNRLKGNLHPEAFFRIITQIVQEKGLLELAA